MLLEYYDWIKALHVVSVISWMAGLLYLPRLFVYHAEAPVGSPQSELFKVMERRLLRGIMNPAMILTWTFGGLMLYAQADFLWEVWFQIKAVAILILTVFHHYLALWRKSFLTDDNTRSPKYYRMINEIPTVLMIVIVFMVILKPF